MAFTNTKKTQDNTTKKIVLFNNYLLSARATLVKSGDLQKQKGPSVFWDWKS